MTNKYRKKSKEELKKVLSDEEYRITQENGTEYPFRNRYNDNYEDGIYVDITTGEPLFIICFYEFFIILHKNYSG